jgi:hypothetical protein
MSISKCGIENGNRFAWFRIQRPDGRRGCMKFGSKFRAAEFAEKAYRKPWPELHKRGYLIVGAQ